LKTQRISFSKIPTILEIPDLLNIQLESYESFLQDNVHPLKREPKGLQKVFLENFPIFDNKEIYRFYRILC
jgi:DNA-directed RNA polymerase subunit beta